MHCLHTALRPSTNGLRPNSPIVLHSKQPKTDFSVVNASTALSFVLQSAKMVSQASGLAVGLNKGHVTTRRELPLAPARRIGVSIRLA